MVPNKKKMVCWVSSSRGYYTGNFRFNNDVIILGFLHTYLTMRQPIGHRLWQPPGGAIYTSKNTSLYVHLYTYSCLNTYIIFFDSFAALVLYAVLGAKKERLFFAIPL